jgi:hypothetical protein
MISCDIIEYMLKFHIKIAYNRIVNSSSKYTYVYMCKYCLFVSVILNAVVNRQVFSKCMSVL